MALKEHMLGIHPAVLLIIGANILISARGFRDFAFFEKYKFNVGAIKRGEYIRFLTAGFLHANWTHLFVNMLTLYFFADPVIWTIGLIPFLVIYFVSLLAGNILSYAFHQNEFHYSAIGASGAVSGVVFSYVILYPDQNLYLFFAIPIKAWIFGIAYLAYSIYGMKNQMGNIGHDAHFGGAVAGYLLTLAFEPQLIESRTEILAIMAIPIVALFVLMKQKRI